MGKMNPSLVSFLFCFCGISLIKALGFSVELIHRDSSKSPFYLPTETRFQRVAKAIHRSINRANHFNKRYISTNTVESDVTPDQGEYIMSYSVGTPPFQVTGVVDTGSGIVWLQCKPCEPCFNQTTPIFDPSKSRTYKNIPCTSDTCHSVRGTSCSSDDQQDCNYFVPYGDGSQSQGDLSLETLTIGSTNGSTVQFPKIVIGCGHSNNNVSFQGGQSSGIVGLGTGSVSLISQLGSSVSGKFSYCLVPYEMSNFSSKLNFGDDAVVSGGDAVSTPMVLEDYYLLYLEGFSVGGNKIDFGSPSSSMIDKPGNIIIDSGTTVTILAEYVYSRLESAVADAIKMERAEDPFQFLNLCYKFTSNKLEVPVITAHFRGADVHLNSLNTFVQVADEVVCFAFRSSPNPNISIFGNLAQQNLLVGYDLQKKLVSFKTTDCTKQ